MGMTAEIRTDCICWEDGSDDCLGCYRSSWEETQELLADWRLANNIDLDGDVEVHGMLVGWQRETIIGTIAADRVIEFLQLRGDYRIQFRLDTDNALVAIRASHDEPTGARFEFRAKQTS